MQKEEVKGDDEQVQESEGDDLFADSEEEEGNGKTSKVSVDQIKEDNIF